MGQEGDRCHEALLARGRSVVRDRVQAYSEASLPDCCTLQVAWDTLRKAMAEETTPEDTYYFSVQELRLLMAAQGVLVEMYTFMPLQGAGNALTHLEPPPYFQQVHHTERVRVVLDLCDDPQQKHGGGRCSPHG